MSELRVGLVAEGPTDAIVIEAVLKALLPKSFVLSQLQPEPTRPRMGTGWGGVLRWCQEFAKRGHSQIEDDPILPDFDLFVLHMDADVAEAKYDDISPEIATIASELGWPVLPFRVPCPPANRSVDKIRDCLLSWSGLLAHGPRTVLCVPSKASEAWLVAALFNNGHNLLNNLECNLNLEVQLSALPGQVRVRKTKREYLARSWIITAQWDKVRQRCTQAERFSSEVLEVGLKR